jgi:glycogen synthase
VTVSVPALAMPPPAPMVNRQLMIAGMRYDFSWSHPGRHYLNIYEYIRHK